MDSLVVSIIFVFFLFFFFLLLLLFFFFLMLLLFLLIRPLFCLSLSLEICLYWLIVVQVFFGLYGT